MSKNNTANFETISFLPPSENRKGEGGLRTKNQTKSSNENTPLVSIITVVYNAERYIEKTISSIIAQTYPNIEYLIIDGGSTDGTVDIIRKHEAHIDYWVSEPDKGIYDAMNKGLKLAHGDYVAILNADDHYLDHAVDTSIRTIQDTQSDYSFANVRYANTSRTIKPIYPLEQNKIYQEMPYPHVSAFIARDIYKHIGLFNTEYRIAGDHDMALRIHLSGYTYCYIDQIIAELETGGISSSSESNKESLRIAVAHGKNHLHAYITYIGQLLKSLTVHLLPESLTKRLLKLKGSRFQ